MGGRYVLIFVVFFLLNVNLFSKDILILPEIDSIAGIVDNIRNSKSDKLRIEYNNVLISYLNDFLKRPESFNANFSKVKGITVLTSDDKLLRVYTWNLQFNDGSYKYFGYLQYKNKNKIDLFFLDDKKYNYDGEIRLYQSHSEWYGAIYYEMVTKKWNSQTYYTLIGWDGADFLINRKVVEVLYFDRKGFPVFGKKLFKLNRTLTGRLVFEYADRATMLLRYNQKQDMIVMDHLSPNDPKYTGIYAYYGPDFSYDALVFRAGKWILQQDIDPNIAINYKRDPKINALKRRGFSRNF